MRRRIAALALAVVTVSMLLGAVAGASARGLTKRAGRQLRRGHRRDATAAATRGCAATDLPPEPANLAAIRSALLCLVDRQRLGHGLGPLASDPALTAAGQHHSTDMIVRAYFSHVSPTGETPERRILRSGYRPRRGWFEIGENLAWGTLVGDSNLASPAALVRSWMASPSHRANILDPHFRDTGFGLALGVPGSPGGPPGLTVTEEFGRRG